MPLCSVHGTADATVPYFQGKIGSLLPPKYVYGSGRLNPRATALGIPNTLRTLKGAGHIPFESNTAYADTTFRTIRDFLRPLLKRPGTVLAAYSASAAQPSAFAYPLARPGCRATGPTHQLARAGRCPAPGYDGPRGAPPHAPGATVQLPRESLSAGIYLLKFAGQARRGSFLSSVTICQSRVPLKKNVMLRWLKHFAWV